MTFSQNFSIYLFVEIDRRANYLKKTFPTLSLKEENSFEMFFFLIFQS